MSTSNSCMNCTNGTKHRLIFIFPQKMPHFCPAIALMNRVVCSAFLLFSFSRFPPPLVPHFYWLRQRCPLWDRHTTHGLDHPLLWYWRPLIADFIHISPNSDLNFCPAEAKGEGLVRNRGWQLCSWLLDAQLKLQLLSLAEHIQHFPQAGFSLCCLKGSTGHSL